MPSAADAASIPCPQLTSAARAWSCDAGAQPSQHGLALRRGLPLVRGRDVASQRRAACRRQWRRLADGAGRRSGRHRAAARPALQRDAGPDPAVLHRVRHSEGPPRRPPPPRRQWAAERRGFRRVWRRGSRRRGAAKGPRQHRHALYAPRPPAAAAAAAAAAADAAVAAAAAAAAVAAARPVTLDQPTRCHRHPTRDLTQRAATQPRSHPATQPRSHAASRQAATRRRRSMRRSVASRRDGARPAACRRDLATHHASALVQLFGALWS
jgi:hypothetical protein